jgi:glycosyltransferase involved in cell wall biosynthesis
MFPINVSIVVPSYNHGRYIGKMIDSVLRQTYTNWELIIVDNHSTDNTDSVILNYSDERIRVVKLNNYGIVSKSRNIGIREAKGKWIAFLDSDDGWYSNKLEKCMEYVEKADIIYHDMQLYKADVDLMLDSSLKSRNLGHPVFKDLLIYGNTLINSSVLVNKYLIESVKGLNEDKEMITAEDYHLWLKIAKRTNRFLYIPERLGFYTMHNMGLSQRDTSAQLRRAVSEFIPELTKREQNYVEAFIRYSRIRMMLHTGKISAHVRDVFFCFIKGTFDIKFKSFFTMLQLSAVKIKGKISNDPIKS